MNWGDLPGWVALAIAVGSGVLSWRSLRWERQGAEAGLRSAEAAERANRLTERMVEHQIAESQAAPPDQQLGPPGVPSGESFGVPAVAQEPPKVTWQIEHPSGNRYVLRNTGTAVADHVEVDATQAGPIARNLPQDSVIRPGQGVDMIIAGTWGHPTPNQLYIRWAGQPEWVAVPMPS
ncbi:uncharacterized protein PO1_contig-068-12 [Mycobacterium sp. PO1]|nr:uncharacterized protein PO1_contig-068-12 [Mycobacterium sp. PO1]GFM27054.1 uncharacterized protein PO2_contig-143-3 [Mycobacterium sp. PO2]